MGLTRKTMSICTLGLVPFRDRAERQARYARQTRNAARASVAMEAAQLQELRGIRDGIDHGNIREEVRDMRRDAPAGTRWWDGTCVAGSWLQRSDDPAGTLRWWDGTRWTEHTLTPGRPQ